MWFFLPLRVKNPPERFPYVTLSLIIINVLVYLCTISYDPDDHFLSVTPQALALLAVSHETILNPVRILTAMFLHSGWEHILGNMWFLWLFGPSVEGRLRPLKFISLYLASGAVGFVLQDVMQGFLDPTMPSLGASGAIMGLSGAYLYTFPFATFRVGWFAWLFSIVPRFGIWEWHARWVVLYYFIENFFGAMVSQAAAHMGMVGGVAHMAHLGGMGTGFLFCLIAKVRKDNERVAAAQAVRADARDYDLLSVHELEALLQHPAEDMRLVIAFCEKSLAAPGGLGEQRCVWAVQTYAKQLAESADQRRLAGILLHLGLDYARSVPTIFFLRLGSNLEHLRDYDMAVRIYQRIYEMAPRHLDAEVALSRLGRMMETVYRSSEHARYYYSEQLRNHPSGRLAEDARRSLAALPYSDVPYR